MPELGRLIYNFPFVLWATFLGILEWIIPRNFYAKDVSGDIVLITGAGSGLGREIALEFAKLGSSLVLWDINQEGLERTKELVQQEHSEISHHSKGTNRFCMIYNVDIGKRDKIYEAAKRVNYDLNVNISDNSTSSDQKRFVSILVNNAGIYYGRPMQDLTDKQIEDIFNVNILSHFWTVRAFLPEMIQYKKGHILEIASIGGLVGSLKQVAYSSTKFAVVGFEESLSIELDYLGLGDYIHTTSVCPYFFNSNLFTGIDQNIIDVSLSCKRIAREAVMSLRCNHNRILLPLHAYILPIIKSFSNRKAIFAWSNALGLDCGLRDIKGRALDD